MGHTPSTAGTFRTKFRKNSGKTPETERFLEFPSGVRLGCPKPYNSRHLRLPEHFQKSLPPSTAGDASFFRSGSGEGLSEPVMEFPAVLGASLKRKTAIHQGPAKKYSNDIMITSIRGYLKEKVPQKKDKTTTTCVPLSYLCGDFFLHLFSQIGRTFVFVFLSGIHLPERRNLHTGSWYDSWYDSCADFGTLILVRRFLAHIFGPQCPDFCADFSPFCRYANKFSRVTQKMRTRSVASQRPVGEVPAPSPL